MEVTEVPVFTEPTPVQALPFLLAYTKAAIAAYGDDPLTAAAKNLTIDSRGDTDDYHRHPLCIVQVSSAAPVSNGPYGAAIHIRARWYVVDADGDTAQEALSALAVALVRSWRERLITDEGWVSHLEITSEPTLMNDMTTTADINDYAMMASIVARRK
jgi:hypothetical protein